MVKSSNVEEKEGDPPEGFDGRNAERPIATHLAALKRFGDIYSEYVRAREKAALAARCHVESAEGRLVEVLATLQKDVQAKLAQAYQRGVDAWDARSSEDSWTQYEDLNRQYVAAAHTIYNDARSQFQESMLALNVDAGKEFNDATWKAYRDYLRALQGAWRGLDVDTLVEASMLAATLRQPMLGGDR